MISFTLFRLTGSIQFLRKKSLTQTKLRGLCPPFHSDLNIISCYRKKTPSTPMSARCWNQDISWSVSDTGLWADQDAEAAGCGRKSCCTHTKPHLELDEFLLQGAWPCWPVTAEVTHTPRRPKAATTWPSRLSCLSFQLLLQAPDVFDKLQKAKRRRMLTSAMDVYVSQAIPLARVLPIFFLSFLRNISRLMCSSLFCLLFLCPCLVPCVLF